MLNMPTVDAQGIINLCHKVSTTLIKEIGEERNHRDLHEQMRKAVALSRDDLVIYETIVLLKECINSLEEWRGEPHSLGIINPKLRRALLLLGLVVDVYV